MTVHSGPEATAPRVRSMLELYQRLRELTSRVSPSLPKLGSLPKSTSTPKSLAPMSTPESMSSSSGTSMGECDSLGSNHLLPPSAPIMHLKTNYANIGQLSSSKSFDQTDLGYESLRQTLMSSTPSSSSSNSALYDVRATNTPIRDLHILTRNAKRAPYHNFMENKNINKNNKVHAKKDISAMPDRVLERILGHLEDSASLARCSRINRRFYSLIWSSTSLWHTIAFKKNKDLDADLALKSILRLTKGQSQTIILNNCAKLTDRGLAIVARRCGVHLRRLEMQHCVDVTNGGLMDLLTKCQLLQHLDVTGCTMLTSVSADNPSTVRRLSSKTPPASPLKKKEFLNLVYVDISECVNIEDNGLCRMLEACPKLVHLYARRCPLITDISVRHASLYCLHLREVSFSDCSLLTSASLLHLSRLGPNLRYLSVSKCPLMSDNGLKQLARLCYKLRYLNARGCELISDEGLEAISLHCTRLRSLDTGKCDISDRGLRFLSENCPNLKRLGLKGCEMISDEGILSVAFYCRGLTQLNVQECPDISLNGVKAVRECCTKCIIEHSKPGLN